MKTSPAATNPCAPPKPRPRTCEDARQSLLQQQAQVDALLASAGGEAAKKIGEALAYRWQRQLTELGKSRLFEAQVAGYRQAPRYYLATLYLDALAEILPQTRRFVVPAEINVPRTVRLDLTETGSALGALLPPEQAAARPPHSLESLMKNALTMTVGLILAAVLLVYMFLFTVRYDEVAVVTTFNRAARRPRRPPRTLRPPACRPTRGLPGAAASSPSRASTSAGPGPSRKSTPTPSDSRFWRTSSAEQQTADGSTVILQTFVVWKIDDPLAFFRQLKTVELARERLQALLANTRSVVSQYRFDQLVNTDPQQVKLSEMEQQMLEQMRQQIGRVSYGMAVEDVGIRRMLPARGRHRAGLRPDEGRPRATRWPRPRRGHRPGRGH